MKRLIAWALALAMILAVMPVSVLAEGEMAIPAAHSHSAAQHKCEHCGEAVTWTAWTSTTSLPTTAGHYYLTADVKISAQAKLTGTTEQVICLNGYTINANSKLVWYLQDTAKLTVSDCTAYTDSEGVFHAATVKNAKQAGAMGAAIYAKNGATLAVYNTIFTNNTLTKNDNSVEGRGGVIQLRGDTADMTVNLHVENCWFQGNNIGQSAGGVNVITTKSTAVAKATVKGCTFKGNNALQGGAIYAISADMTVEDCHFEGNTAETGAAIFAKTCTAMTVKNCTFQENVSSKGATFHVNKCLVTVDQCTFDGNIGKTSGGSVLHIHGSGGHLVLKDSTLKNNASTSKGDTHRGTVYLTNKVDDLTLQGKVVFENNTRINKAGDVLPAAVYVQDNPNPIDVGALATGSQVFVETREYEAADLNEIFVAATAPAAWDHTVLTYNDIQVDYSQINGFVPYEAPAEPEPEPEPDPEPEPEPEPPAPDHQHCQCGEAECTAHEMVAYTKWEDATSLPTAGNYYLTVDVNLAAETSVSGDLQLCLNGHTVTAANNKRHLSTPKNSGYTVVISDCTAAYDAAGNYTAGKFTGGKDVSGNAGGGSLYMRDGTTLKFFDGIVAGNTTVYGGAGIFVMTDSVLEMYDGLLTDNIAQTADGKSWKVGGNIRSNGGHVKIYGGTIENGSGVNGGGVYGKGGTILITGNTILRGNYSSMDGAGVYMNGGELTISGNVLLTGNHTDGAGSAVCFGGNSTGSVTGATIENNTGSSGAGAIVQNGAKAAFTNVTVRNNTATGNGGGVYVYKAELTMTGCTVTGNTAKTGVIHATSSAVLTLENCTVTGNTATSQTGGVHISETSSVILKGNVTIRDNTRGNLNLLGGTLMDVTGLTGGQILITADMGPISTPCTDKTELFTSEAAYRGVEYRDGALYMATDGNHKHCFCGGAGIGCDHQIVEWSAWESTDSLPASGSYYLLGDVVLSGEQSITSNLNLCLNGYSIKAAEGKRHISTVKGTNVTITICDCTASYASDGTYTAGKFFGGNDLSTDAGGGAIYIRSSSTLKFYDGIVTGNSSKNVGGGIFLNENGKLYFYEGQVNGNTAKNGGGVALYIAQGNILGGTIFGNEAEAGGGIYATGKTSKVTLSDVTVSENHATVKGGALYATNAQFTIDRAIFADNKCDATVGGLYLSTNCVATMKNSQVTGNTATQGAGIALSEATLDLENSNIDNNTASSVGGGIALYHTCHLNMASGTISGNKSGSNGGGIYATGGVINITGGTIANNYGVKDGGGAYLKNAEMNVSGKAVFTKNETKVNGGAISYGTNATGTISGGTFKSNTAASGGGALMIQNGAKVTITDGSFVSNTGASARGGAIRLYKGDLTVTGGTFEKNKSPKSAGGAIGASTNCTLIMTGGTIKNNTAKNNAGGIALSTNANAKLSNVTITGNTGDKDGGGVYVYKGRLDIGENVVISGNTTKVNGGAVSYGTGSSGYVSGLTATGNNASSGGGLMIQGNAQVTIGYAYIANNNAKKYAGGIYLYKANLTMTGGTITGNSCKSIGGGIYSDSGVTLKLSNVKITKNQSKNGGATYAKNTIMTANNLLIQDNTATNLGGAMYFTGGANWGKLYPSQLTDCKIIGNKATGETSNGGGLYLNTDVEVTCNNCRIAENYTTQYGGGAYAAQGAMYTFNSCTIEDNESAQNGGGVLVWDRCQLNDTLVCGNKAQRGAGVFAGNPYERYAVNGFGSKGDDVGLNMINCTIEGNHASIDGGGLHLDMSCYTTIHDTIFTGNTAGEKGSAMWLWENCTMTDVTVTGNLCANDGFAVYLADSEYDGQTYINGLFKMGGNMIIRDNEGGDLFLDNYVTIGALKDGYGPKTYMNITLDANLLTQRVMGVYNYEGGNLVYTLTYGDRSMTDPEFDASKVVVPAAQEQEKTNSGDILLYVGIGVVALAAIAGAVLVIGKKKKSAGAESK